MKQFWMALAMMALVPLNSQADVITIGGESIRYETPAGYVQATGERYQDAFAFFKKAMPENTQVHAMYISAKNDATFGKKERQMLDDYILVTSNRKIEDYTVSLQDFGELKQQIAETQEKALDASIKDASNKILDKATDGALKIGAAKSLGIIDESDTLLAFMVVLAQSVTVDGKSMVFEQAFVSTTMLVKGKILTINNYRIVTSQADIDRFKEDDKRAIASMDFKQGTTAGTDSLSLSPKSKGPLSSGLTWAVIGGLIGAGIYFFRRRKGNPAARQTPQDAQRTIEIGENLKDNSDNKPDNLN